MGCGGSSPLPSEVEAPVIEVPGGNGVVYPQKLVKAMIPLILPTLDSGAMSIKADMADVNGQITAESTAGAGFRFVAFNYPVGNYRQSTDHAGLPLAFRQAGTLLEPVRDSFGMMTFQQVDMPALPLETKTVSSEMTINSNYGKVQYNGRNDHIDTTATGYDELFSKLKLLLRLPA